MEPGCDLEHRRRLGRELPPRHQLLHASWGHPPSFGPRTSRPSSSARVLVPSRTVWPHWAMDHMLAILPDLGSFRTLQAASSAQATDIVLSLLPSQSSSSLASPLTLFRYGPRGPRTSWPRSSMTSTSSSTSRAPGAYGLLRQRPSCSRSSSASLSPLSRGPSSLLGRQTLYPPPHRLRPHHALRAPSSLPDYKPHRRTSPPS